MIWKLILFLFLGLVTPSGLVSALLRSDMANLLIWRLHLIPKIVAFDVQPVMMRAMDKERTRNGHVKPKVDCFLMLFGLILEHTTQIYTGYL